MERISLKILPFDVVDFKSFVKWLPKGYEVDNFFEKLIKYNSVKGFYELDNFCEPYTLIETEKKRKPDIGFCLGRVVLPNDFNEFEELVEKERSKVDVDLFGEKIEGICSRHYSLLSPNHKYLFHKYWIDAS